MLATLLLSGMAYAHDVCARFVSYSLLGGGRVVCEVCTHKPVECREEPYSELMQAKKKEGKKKRQERRE